MKHLICALMMFVSLEAISMDKFCNGAPTVIHANGGGHVSISASVSALAYVGVDASVCEFAMVYGNAEIRDSAKIYGTARISEGNIISAEAEVFGSATISSTFPEFVTVTDNSKVYGNSRILNSAIVRGSSQVSENARVANTATVEGTSKIFGNSTVSGNALVQGASLIHGSANLAGNTVANATANVCEGRYFAAGTILNSNLCTKSPRGALTTIQASIGNFGVCSVYTTGRLRCWGLNSMGQLGYGNTVTIGDNEVPTSVGYVSTGGKVTKVAAGSFHVCALFDNQKVRCWGGNGSGQLGDGNSQNIGDNELPSSVGYLNVGGNVTQITAGNTHSCVLLDTGKVRCWGGPSSPALGYPNLSNPYQSPAVNGDVNVGGTVTQIEAGYDFTCALLDTGAVRCWGANTYGQLGYGNTTIIGDNEAPAIAGDVQLGGPALSITAGEYFSCALMAAGNVKCWGNNNNGALGYGHLQNIGDNELPSSVGFVSIGGPAIQVEAGSNFACALLANGDTKCWGLNTVGQLGLGHKINIGDDELPSSVGPLSLGTDAVVKLSIGGSSVCALKNTGRLLCWGANFSGQLGLGHTNIIGDDELPSTIVETPNFTDNF